VIEAGAGCGPSGHAADGTSTEDSLDLPNQASIARLIRQGCREAGSRLRWSRTDVNPISVLDASCYIRVGGAACGLRSRSSTRRR